AHAQQSVATRPNIVFILTDDQDLLLNSMEYMPQTRALIADRGMTFAQDFVPLSLCCPSRSTILTGLYPHNHKVYTNHGPDGGFDKFEELGHEGTTIGTALHAAGYRTALLGKYLNHYPKETDPTHVPPGWDEFASPAAGGPYNGFHYTLNENGRLVQYGGNPQDYLTDVIAGKATAFIRGSAAAGKPFFLYLATYAPHKPAVPAPRHAALFPGLQAPRTPSFNEADVSDKPTRIRNLPLLTEGHIRQIDGLYRRRIQSLQAVDEAVAAVVHTLESTGQLENTYIFFTSDNGFHMGQHRMLPGKYTPYETDIHMPLYVRGPGIAAGSSTSAATSSVDFAPTIAELAGATLQLSADGRSFVPILHGQTPGGWRQVVLLEQFEFTPDNNPPSDILEPPDPQDGGVLEYPAHLGVRVPDFKYVEYASGDREVYDLRNDPDELNNLASHLDPAWLSQMSGIIRALGACAGDACRTLEAQPLPPLPPSLSTVR
ncbi:MAG TPA: sulfatase, partial [Thermoanaerobaculia bacterium]